MVWTILDSRCSFGMSAGVECGFRLRLAYVYPTVSFTDPFVRSVLLHLVARGSHSSFKDNTSSLLECQVRPLVDMHILTRWHRRST